jgi:hypothetical protein
MSSDMPLNAWADKDGIEPPDLGLTSQPQSPPAGDNLARILQNYKEYVTGVYQGVADYDEDTALFTLRAYILAEVRTVLDDIYSHIPPTFIGNPSYKERTADEWRAVVGRIAAYVQDYDKVAATARFGAPADKLQGRYE